MMMMMTTPETRHYPVVESVIDVFARWLKHRRDIAELCNCGSEEYAHIARDLSVSTGELDELVRRGAHAADALPKMMAALHIDRKAVARVEPMIMRDLERVCSLCERKQRCEHELTAGTAAEHYADFCSNASTLETLVPKSR
jgi:K+-sensing histidine kinase KdpD